MTKREIFSEGKARGECAASWCEIPELGSRIPREIDWVGYEIVTKENLLDVCIMYCRASESNDRDFSPFEFTAKALNDEVEKKPYDVWQEYDRGIDTGIVRALRKRLRK